MRYRLTVSTHADTPGGERKLFSADSVVTDEDMLAGCLESLVNRREAVEYTEADAFAQTMEANAETTVVETEPTIGLNDVVNEEPVKGKKKK